MINSLTGGALAPRRGKVSAAPRMLTPIKLPPHRSESRARLLTAPARRLLQVGLCLVAVAFSAQSSIAAEPASNKNYVGINVWFHNDWDGAHAFADIVKHSRSWRQYNDGNAELTNVDSAGWPNEDGSLIVSATTSEPGINTGTFKLIFEGKAQTIQTLWVSGSISNHVYNASTNTTTADVLITAATGEAVQGGLKFGGTRRNNDANAPAGIRNVRLYRPGIPTDGTVTFTPQFLNLIKKFQVVRTMDWVVANTNGSRTWSGRTLPTFASQSRDMSKTSTAYQAALTDEYIASDFKPDLKYEVAYEYHILLANQANADLWINVPVLADDNYITQLATLIRDGNSALGFPGLNSNLKLYVEYGNEIWNPGYSFHGFRWVRDIVNKLPSTHPIKSDGTTDINTLYLRYQAYRSAQISDTFRQVFGNDQMHTRIRPFLGAQTGGNTASTCLQEIERLYGSVTATNSVARPPNHFFYGVGGAIYFDPADGTNIDTVVASFPTEQNINSMLGDIRTARRYGLRPIAYEGGPALGSALGDGSSNYTEAQRRAINADSRMRGVVSDLHNLWVSIGGDLPVYYVTRGPSDWEFTPSISNLTSPKLLGVADIIAAPNKVATTRFGALIPGDVTLEDSSIFSTPDSYTLNDSVEGLVRVIKGPKKQFTIIIRNNTSQTYTVSLRSKSDTAGTVSLRLNNEPVGSFTSTTTFTNAGAVPVAIPVGVHALTVDSTVDLTTARVVFTGAITRRYWTGLSGDTIASLTGSSAYPSSPTGSDTLTQLEGKNWAGTQTSNFANTYGQRIHGYLVAPATGAYTFWISGDDHVELWLGTSAEPSTKSRIAYHTSYTGYRVWTSFGTQKSAPVNLVAGQRYYIEVLHKEGGGNDSVSVGWAKPGQSTSAPSEIVPGSVLQTFNTVTLVVPVPNPSFEAASGWSAATNWTTTSSSVEVRTNAVTGKDGNNYAGLFVDNGSGTGTTTGTLSSAALGAFEANTTYTLTVAEATDSPASNRIAAIGLSADGVVVGTTATVSNLLTGSFQDRVYTVNTAQNTAIVGKQIRVILRHEHSGSYGRMIFFDDIALVKSAN